MRAAWKFVVAMCAVASLGGCVTSGTQFKLESVDQLQPGVSTEADAIKLLGPPNSESSYADGTELLQWIGVKAVYISATSNHVAILFGPDKRMIRVTMKTHTQTN